MIDDGVASTRALADSLLSYKMNDNGSINSYRILNNGHTSASASGSVKSGYAPIEVHVGGDDIGASYARSSSPVSDVSLFGDEVAIPGVSLRRSARRTRFRIDRQTSDNASLVSEDHSHVVDHVRFDDNVSYIGRIAQNDDNGCPPEYIEGFSNYQQETFSS